MRLIFLNRYFYPDHSATSQLLSDLAFALAKRGHKVDVITSRQIYDAPEERLPTQDILGGLAIHRVWTSRFGRQNLIGRTVDYLTFYASAASTLCRITRSGDILIVKTDPPMLSVIAAPIAHFRGARLVTWLQDLFPEVAEAVGFGRGRLAGTLYRALRFMRNRSLNAAAINVAIGERMALRLGMLGIRPDRICIIANWADGALLTPQEGSRNQLREAWGLADQFVVGYSGNLGRAHEYGTLLEAIAHVEQQRELATAGDNLLLPTTVGGPESRPMTSEIVWLFIGGGALWESLRREVTQRRLTSVRFEPYQPRAALAESLSAADVHLVTLRPELEGLIVPSKFYGIAAAGRPAIFIGETDGEIARLIARHGCGRIVAAGDGIALARTILELATDPRCCRQMGARARHVFEAEFDKPLAVACWENLLREIDDSPRLQSSAINKPAPEPRPPRGMNRSHWDE